jgi:hypothetical protein
MSMKKIPLFLVLSVSVIFSSPAQDTKSLPLPPPPTANAAPQPFPMPTGAVPEMATMAPPLVVTGDDGELITLSSTKEQEITLHLRNSTDHALTVTHLNLNGGAAFVPITPLEIAPNESKLLKLIIDGRRLMLPGQIMALFRIREAGDEHVLSVPLRLTSKDVFVFEPHSLGWKMGADLVAKTTKILSTPAGFKITGVKSSSPGFSARLEGASIIVTPADTSKPQSAAVILSTEPAQPRPAMVFVGVMPAIPTMPRATPAPGSSPALAPKPAASLPPAAAPAGKS